MPKIDFAINDEGKRISILSDKINRHGFIAGATGTGKTVSLKVLAEKFSALGIPVFVSDVKGDLSGLLKPGEAKEGIEKRKEECKLTEEEFRYQGFPVELFALSKEEGIPLRCTISEMGPLLLSRVLNCTDVQSDILRVVFRIADEEGLLLIDTKDLRSVLQYVAENSKEYSASYGNLPTQSLNALIRSVVALEEAGGKEFFGEPALDVKDFFRQNEKGQGIIHLFNAKKIMGEPKLYSTFLLYLLSELYELLPEVGDLEKPRFVFFFDEAHLLFDDAPKALLEKLNQITRLIRSKGVGIYYITQSPSDIPDAILAQCGNKIQHGLRAYTPAERKKIRAAADSFRENPAFSSEEVLENLGTGEALISCLEEDGSPAIVEKARVFPPQSYLGEASPEEQDRAVKASTLYIRYGEAVDRDSAYEFLHRKGKEEQERFQKELAEKEEEKNRLLQEKAEEKERAKQEKEEEKAQRLKEKEEEKERLRQERELEKEKSKQKTVIKSVGRSVSGSIGREIGSGIGKSVFGKGLGRRLGGNIGAAFGRGILETLFGK